MLPIKASSPSGTASASSDSAAWRV
jgi:hypothetical protein